MKAVICTQYGPPEVLQLQDVAKPVPKDNEILIRIRAAHAFAGDCEMRRFEIPPLFWLFMRLYMGILKPRINIYGQEFSGEVEAIGKDVTRFKPGDAVFGATDMRLGAHAEYLCLRATNAITTKPSDITDTEAATITVGGLNALYFLRKSRIQPGEHILINGAGGSIGTWAVQLAKFYGAEVTAVDSTGKLDTLRAIGADHVIDYTQTDFWKTGERYDVILDIANKQFFGGKTGSLKPKGRYLIVNFGISILLKSLWTSLVSNKRLLTGGAGYHIPDMDYLVELIKDGTIKSIIDRSFPLEQMVKAHRYVDSGKKTGHVAITIA